MVSVIWAEPALADLEEIYRFIAKDSPRYARLMVERLTAAAARRNARGELAGGVSLRSARARPVGPQALRMC